MEPKRPELFLYLGTAYFRAKEYDRAAETLQEGLRLDDKQKDLHFQLGVVYEKQSQFDDAVTSFSQRDRARSQATPRRTTTSATCTPSAARTSTRRSS